MRQIAPMASQPYYGNKLVVTNQDLESINVDCPSPLIVILLYRCMGGRHGGAILASNNRMPSDSSLGADVLNNLQYLGGERSPGSPIAFDS